MSVTAAQRDAKADPAPRRAAADKRALILEAATKVFARNGYHGSRVSDIANEAGIAYGLVYHYFKNKDEILDTIFQEGWSGFLETAQGVAESTASTEDKLLRIAALILGAHRVNPDWVRVLVFEIQRSSRFAEPEQVRAIGRLFEIVARILRDGQRNGELRDDLDPDIGCYLFVGGLDLVVTGRVLQLVELEGTEGEGAFHGKLARTLVESFLRGFERREPTR